MTTTSDIKEQALGWFVQLSDADAPVSAWLAFQDWLEVSDSHRLAYDAVERTWVDLDGTAAAPVVMAVAANDGAPVRLVGVSRSRTAWLVPAFAVAAALVIVVGVWPQLGGLTGSQVYRTDDQPRTVELSDGSHIYLNRHSKLSVRLKGDSRAVTLADGEAAFDVTHDPARPFVITAGDHDVRVLGTAFNVLNHDGRFSVGVERGVVAVTPSKAAAPVRLAAGQRIDQTGSASPVLSRVDPDRASAWRQGVLIYRDAALADVANDLSRYLDKPVTVSTSAQPLHFTGALRVGDEATMLDQLQVFVPIRTDRSPTGVRLTARGAY
ncbi:FecR family protein [soil metagenome]